MVVGFLAAAILQMLHGTSILTQNIVMNDMSSPGPKSRADLQLPSLNVPRRVRRLLLLLVFQACFFQAAAVRDARVFMEALAMKGGDAMYVKHSSDLPKQGAQRQITGISWTSATTGSLTYSKTDKRAFRRARLRAERDGGTFYKGRWMPAKAMQLERNSRTPRNNMELLVSLHYMVLCLVVRNGGNHLTHPRLPANQSRVLASEFLTGMSEVFLESGMSFFCTWNLNKSA